MEKKVEPDIITDVCPDCGGLWLDRGELNRLATGMGGDIEFCSIDTEEHKDRFHERSCPHCPEQPLNKINLLSCSEIIFDHCARCGGFFLDSGELEESNRYLAEMTQPGTPEQFRGRIDDHLVTLRKIEMTQIGPSATFGKGGGTLMRLTHKLRLSVYFKGALEVGLCVFPAPWGQAFWKLLGLSRKQDIETGSGELDSAFVIRGKHEAWIRSAVSSRVFRDAMIDFMSAKPSLFNEDGYLEITDKRVVYTENLTNISHRYDVEEDPQAIVSRMLTIAKALEYGLSR